jgi:hypothetical protein
MPTAIIQRLSFSIMLRKPFDGQSIQKLFHPNQQAGDAVTGLR